MRQLNPLDILTDIMDVGPSKNHQGRKRPERGSFVLSMMDGRGGAGQERVMGEAGGQRGFHSGAARELTRWQQWREQEARRKAQAKAQKRAKKLHGRFGQGVGDSFAARSDYGYFNDADATEAASVKLEPDADLDFMAAESGSRDHISTAGGIGGKLVVMLNGWSRFFDFWVTRPLSTWASGLVKPLLGVPPLTPHLLIAILLASGLRSVLKRWLCSDSSDDDGGSSEINHHARTGNASGPPNSAVVGDVQTPPDAAGLGATSSASPPLAVPPLRISNRRQWRGLRAWCVRFLPALLGVLYVATVDHGQRKRLQMVSEIRSRVLPLALGEDGFSRAESVEWLNAGVAAIWHQALPLHRGSDRWEYDTFDEHDDEHLGPVPEVCHGTIPGTMCTAWAGGLGPYLSATLLADLEEALRSSDAKPDTIASVIPE